MEETSRRSSWGRRRKEKKKREGENVYNTQNHFIPIKFVSTYTRDVYISTIKSIIKKGFGPNQNTKLSQLQNILQAQSKILNLFKVDVLITLPFLSSILFNYHKLPIMDLCLQAPMSIWYQRYNSSESSSSELERNDVI